MIDRASSKIMDPFSTIRDQTPVCGIRHSGDTSRSSARVSRGNKTTLVALRVRTVGVGSNKGVASTRRCNRARQQSADVTETTRDVDTGTMILSEWADSKTLWVHLNFIQDSKSLGAHQHQQRQRTSAYTNANRHPYKTLSPT